MASFLKCEMVLPGSEAKLCIASKPHGANSGLPNYLELWFIKELGFDAVCLDTSNLKYTKAPESSVRLMVYKLDMGIDTRNQSLDPRSQRRD